MQACSPYKSSHVSVLINGLKLQCAQFVWFLWKTYILKSIYTRNPRESPWPSISKTPLHYGLLPNTSIQGETFSSPAAFVKHCSSYVPQLRHLSKILFTNTVFVWFNSRIYILRYLKSEKQFWKLDREAWHAAVHEVAKSWTRLSNWTEPNSLVGYHASTRKLQHCC